MVKLGIFVLADPLSVPSLRWGLYITNHSKDGCGNVLTRCPGISTIVLIVKNELHLETEYLGEKDNFYKALFETERRKKKF